MVMLSISSWISCKVELNAKTCSSSAATVARSLSVTASTGQQDKIFKKLKKGHHKRCGKDKRNATLVLYNIRCCTVSYTFM